MKRFSIVNNGYDINNADSSLIKDDEGNAKTVKYSNENPDSVDGYIFEKSNIPAALDDWANNKNLDSSVKANITKAINKRRNNDNN